MPLFLRFYKLYYVAFYLAHRYSDGIDVEVFDRVDNACGHRRSLVHLMLLCRGAKLFGKFEQTIERSCE